MGKPAPLPSGTVTFLFTDIEGSTRLWEQQPEAMREALARHDALITDAIQQCSGRVVKSQGEGDSFFAVFARATDGVAAACALQHALFAERWPPGAPLRVRAALHTGEADLRGGDYYGAAVSRCARLRAAAHGGQVLLSGSTQQLVQDRLPSDISLRDLGLHRLRDLQRAEHVFQLLHPALPADFGPLQSLDVLPNNLPQQVTSFVGREQQIAEAKRLLAKTRLVTLTGAGGTGKTRLALQVAADLSHEYGDGVWLVELAPLADPALVPQAVATALTVREEPGRPLTQTLLEWLGRKDLLMVLDNCEHLLTASACWADAVIRTCPGLRLLATSWEALGIAGEQTYRMPPFSLPDAHHLPPLEALHDFDAVRLFAERACLSQPAFAVTKGNAAAVVQVCQRLDGIPLAIELAAARVKMLSVEQIAARMDDMFRLLTGGSRTALPRHQTLQAAMDWSYGLLSETERQVLRSLSVFAGGWTLEAAEAVCRGERIEPPDVLDLLSQLIDKSLVMVEEAVQGEVRYRLLEPVRQYSRIRLAEAGEATAAQERHLRYFLRLAEGSKREHHGAQRAEWVDRWERDHDNVRSALRWSLEQPEGAELGLRLVLSASLFYNEYNEHHRAETRAWLKELLDRSEGASTPLHARALGLAGRLAFHQGDRAIGRTLQEQAVAIAQQSGELGLVGDLLSELGLMLALHGDAERARAVLEQAVATLRTLASRKAEDRRGLGWALRWLGVLSAQQRDWGPAQATLEESLEVSRAEGDKGGVAYSVVILGDVVYLTGDSSQARLLLEEGRAIAQELHDKEHLAEALQSLALMALDEGDLERADDLVQESWALRQEFGERPGILAGLEIIAALNAAHGHSEPAARLFGSADALREVYRIGRYFIHTAAVDRYTAVIRTQLSGQAFETAWAEGRGMTLEQAISEALVTSGAEQ